MKRKSAFAESWASGLTEPGRWPSPTMFSIGPRLTDTQPSYGYHPCMIWPDWFHEEPEDGSHPIMGKNEQLAME